MTLLHNLDKKKSAKGIDGQELFQWNSKSYQRGKWNSG